MGNSQAKIEAKRQRNLRDARPDQVGVVPAVPAVPVVPVIPVTSSSQPSAQQKALGVLYFRIVEAKLATGKNGVTAKATAPFVRISFADRFYDTRVMERENPYWNQEFHLFINNSQFYDNIDIDVMDMSSFTRYGRVGTLCLRVNELVRDFEPHDVWMSITAPKSKTVGPNMDSARAAKKRWGINTIRRGSKKIGKNKFTKRLRRARPEVEVASLHVLMQLKPMEEVVNHFWISVAREFDFDGNGMTDAFEFKCLLQAIGSNLDDTTVDSLIPSNANNSTGAANIPIHAIPSIMAKCQKQHLIRMTNCPVCGGKICNVRHENPECKSDFEVIAHISPCLEAHAHEETLIANFLLDVAGMSWWKEGLTEWKNHNQLMRETGGMVVCDRESKQLVEEKVPVIMQLGMRALYSASPNNGPIACEFLTKLTRIIYEKYNDACTRKHIPKFLRFYGIDVDEIQDHIGSFRTLNEFFYRKIKPHSRPVADPTNQRIAVVPADSRIMVFQDFDSMKKWVKGPGFSVENLLKDFDLAKDYQMGSFALCRITVSDAHRLVFPVSCKVGETKIIDGAILPDLPVAVREEVDILTVNRRIITPLEDTPFGRVLMVCVGASMEGFTSVTREVGDRVKKGDAYGYFSYGSLTILLMFPPDTLIFPDDLFQNSEKPIETFCKMGSPLGVMRT